MNFKKLNIDPTCSIDSDGNKFWFNKNNKYHRKNGPATEYANGGKEWYINGQRHHEDGPAIEYSNGLKEWWLNNKRHRKDGPAVEWLDRYKEWWINGKYYPTEKEYWLKIYEMKLITKKELFLKLL